MTINLTVQSQNSKIIDIIDINNFQTVSSGLKNNQTVELGFSNYLIDIKSSAESMTIDNLFTNVDKFNSDIIFVVLFVSLFVILMAGIEFLKRVGK